MGKHDVWGDKMHQYDKQMFDIKYHPHEIDDMAGYEDDEYLPMADRAAARPQAMMMICGPTGCGASLEPGSYPLLLYYNLA
jgi:hypothetical protein